MSGHEDTVAEYHAEAEGHRDSTVVHDMTGAEIHKGLPDDQLTAVGDTADDEEPNEQEKASLRRMGENLPASAFLVAIVELCERFTYYGAQGLFQNYISNPLDGTLGAPGLGLTHQAATGLNVFFQFFAYLTPILGAIVADQYLGKYKTIVIFAVIYWVGLIVLWTTALPGPLNNGAGLPGYIVAIVIIGLGTGGIKSNIAPLIADQYQRTKMTVKTLGTGERVIIDPTVTYQRIYMIFYGCINVGSLSLFATPFMERNIGFWAAFLLSFCMFTTGLIILLICRKFYIDRPPQGSVITDSFKAVGMMIRERNGNAPKPSWRAANGKGPVPWDDHFIDLLRRALIACKIFAFYPLFWVCYLQFSSNFVAQAAQMMGHGMPNDLMQNFDPVAILVALPILDRLVYPLLRRYNIKFRPMARITLGFFCAALGLAYAAIVQKLIYSAGPCYEHPRSSYCADRAPDGITYLGNNVHIAVQTPAYVFIGLGEIFLNVTGLEYAYTKAPPQMKSFVQALYLVTTAFGAALTEALVPATTDPAILWMYTGIAVAGAVAGICFWLLFHHLDALEDEMNALDKNRDVLKNPHVVDEERKASVAEN